jgi:hypothetical protein
MIHLNIVLCGGGLAPDEVRDICIRRLVFGSDFTRISGGVYEKNLFHVNFNFSFLQVYQKWLSTFRSPTYISLMSEGFFI